MKTKTILVVVALALLSSVVFAQKQGASDAVKSFYNFHRSRTGVFNSYEVELRKKWFSNNLYKLFLNELKREKEFLKNNPTDKPFFGDGFPFQPYDECSKENKSYPNRYETDTSSIDGNKTIVAVKFYNPKQCDGSLIETFKVELIKSKEKWLIDDWVYADGKRLTDDLKRENY